MQVGTTQNVATQGGTAEIIADPAVYNGLNNFKLWLYYGGIYSVAFDYTPNTPTVDQYRLSTGPETSGYFVDGWDRVWVFTQAHATNGWPISIHAARLRAYIWKYNTSEWVPIGGPEETVGPRTTIIHTAYDDSLTPSARYVQNNCVHLAWSMWPTGNFGQAQVNNYIDLGNCQS